MKQTEEDQLLNSIYTFLLKSSGGQKVYFLEQLAKRVAKLIKEGVEQGRMLGYKNVWSWFENFNYPALNKDSKGCGVCGGKLTIIRGRYPHTPKRKVCPTCAVEIIESIVDNLRSNIDGASQKEAISTL